MCFENQTCRWLLGFYSFIVTSTLVHLIYWLIIFPKEVEFTVTNTSIKRFDIERETLFYDLAVNVSIRNPNSQVGVYFDRVEAVASYRGKRFSAITWLPMSPFHLSRNKKASFQIIFKGHNKITSLNRRDLEHYIWETRSRVYLIDVKLGLQVRTKYRKIKSGPFKPPKIDCDKLKFVLLNGNYNGTIISSVVDTAKFRVRMCKNVYILFSSEIDDDMFYIN